MQPDIPAWIDWLLNRPWLFVFLFVAQWALVSYVISLLSGWMELSRRFRDAGAYYSYQWPFQSVRMRTIFGSYGNCVNFGADETGLYMAVFRPFRLGHPPLFYPLVRSSGSGTGPRLNLQKPEAVFGTSGINPASRQVITRRETSTSCRPGLAGRDYCNLNPPRKARANKLDVGSN